MTAYNNIAPTRPTAIPLVIAPVATWEVATATSPLRAGRVKDDEVSAMEVVKDEAEEEVKEEVML